MITKVFNNKPDIPNQHVIGNLIFRIKLFNRSLIYNILYNNICSIYYSVQLHGLYINASLLYRSSYSLHTIAGEVRIEYFLANHDQKHYLNPDHYFYTYR